ncbi:heme NO-binding domain-containing protein [Thalassotalea sp. PLHSN55]|uniref:heme NO-binding domain-containing protein n=1 Tax=Thalassotalea sp. PLHSN55 TaxID=3435888 RepID=UPI003F85CFF0
MQGSIFTAFSEMIIEKMGMSAWNELLESVNPSSDGVYTSGMQYDDSELMALVAALSKKTNTEATELVKAFGGFLFIHLFKASPADVSHIDNLKDFLTCIDSVIHKEVQRVYPHAYLPTFNYEETPEGDLIMYYHSKRKLCHLSEGLIESAANHYHENIRIAHPECMHHGAEKCKLIISFED